MDAIYIFSKSKNGETKPPWADFKVVTEGPGEDCIRTRQSRSLALRVDTVCVYPLTDARTVTLSP
jgi:hypothetical protein